MAGSYTKINTNTKSDRIGYQSILFLLMFFAGTINSKDYLVFMGLNELYIVIELSFYFLLSILFLSTILKYLLRKKKYPFYSFPYWIILIIAVILKIIILFVQNPSWIIPGGGYFYQLRIIAINFILMILLARRIQNITEVKYVIWGLALGTSFSAIIPFLFFPEMIGSRAIVVDDYIFTGGFWNSSVISFISVGWLLIALYINESSKLKKNILIGLFTLFVLGGLAGLSRAMLLSILLSVIFYLITSKQFVKYIKIIILIVLFFFGLIYFFPQIIDNFEQRLSGGINIEEEARTLIWKDYLEDLPDYFIFGELEGNYKKYSNTGHGPHSVLLNWLTQYGILALFGFFVIIFGIVTSIRRIKKSVSIQVAAALYAWLFSYLSVAVINETGFSQLTIYGAFGIILGWGNSIKKQMFKVD